VIIDARLQFAAAVALDTGGTGLALLGDVIDLGVARDVGLSDQGQLYFIVRVDTPVTSEDAATVQFELASDAQAAIATDGSATVHAATGPIAKATLVAGYFAACIPVPAEGIAYERFLGVLTNVGVAALTGGKVDAYLSHEAPSWTAWRQNPDLYPSGSPYAT
jgi:hypothetical protein